MIRRPPRSSRHVTLVPYTALFRAVAGRLAGDGAQAEARLRVEAGRLQTAVVEGQRFRLPVLEEQLPVVGTVHGIVLQGFEPVAVEAGTRVEKLVGGGEVCHQAGLRAEVCVGLSIRSCCDQLALILGTEPRLTSRSEENTSALQSLMRNS